MQVFLVSEGIYDDWHVVAIFSTKKAANACCARLGKDADVEAWEVDPVLPALTMPRWRVRLDWEGTVLQIAPERETLDPYQPCTPLETQVVDWEEGQEVTVTCFAAGETQAVDSANAQRRQFLRRLDEHEARRRASRP
jgi:hypothetical protein